MHPAQGSRTAPGSPRSPAPGGLDKLLADRLPLWRWAAFTSVLVQRRNTVQRLRVGALGYQPRGGIQHDGRYYSALAFQVMQGSPIWSLSSSSSCNSPRLHRSVEEFEAWMTARRAGCGPAHREPLIDYQSFPGAGRTLPAHHGQPGCVFVQDMGASPMCPLVWRAVPHDVPSDDAGPVAGPMPWRLNHAAAQSAAGRRERHDQLVSLPVAPDLEDQIAKIAGGIAWSNAASALR